MNSLILVLASIGVFQALFLSVYLLTRSSLVKKADIFLACILIGLSIRIGKSIFNHYYEIEAWARNIGLAGFLLVGPSLYFYIRLALAHRVPSSSELITHYLLSLVYLIFCYWIPNEQSLASYASYSLVMLQMFVYLILGEKIRRNALINGYVSSEISRWIKGLLLGLLFIWIFYILIFIGILPYYIGGAVFYSGLVYLFSFLILRKHRFTLDKYIASPVSPEQKAKIFQLVQTKMENEQWFLEPDLKLETVAKRVGQDYRLVSQSINQRTGQNFSEFTNHYRIKYATKLIAENTTSIKKIAVVAAESGFGNVTSFNQCFKSIMGETPSSYRKRLKIS